MFNGCTAVVEPLYTNANCPKAEMCADAFHSMARLEKENTTKRRRLRMQQNQDSSIYSSQDVKQEKRHHTREDTGEEAGSSKNGQAKDEQLCCSEAPQEPDPSLMRWQTFRQTILKIETRRA